MNISQFFTRNKSLKFFIGDEIGTRPKSTSHKRGVSGLNTFNNKNNHSSHVHN